MAEDFKPKDVWVAAEDARRTALRNKAGLAQQAASQMKQVEGTDEFPTSDLTNTRLVLGALFVVAPFTLWGEELPNITLGSKSLALDTLVPKLSNITFQMLGGEVADRTVRKVLTHVMPKHTTFIATAGIISNVIGALSLDPAAIEILTTKLGIRAVKDIGQAAFKDEQLELFEKLVDDPHSEQAIAKAQQMEKVRISNTQAKQQAEELASRTRLPPEQIPMEEQLQKQFPDFFTDENLEKLGLKPVTEPPPVQGELIPKEAEAPDFESHQGSSGKIVSAQEQFELFAHRAEQGILELGDALGAEGKDEAFHKVAKGAEAAKFGWKGFKITNWGGFVREFLYNGLLANLKIAEAKVVTDTAFLATQTISKSLAIAVEHGPIAGAHAAMAATYAWGEALNDALRWGFKAGVTLDSPAFQESLGLGKEATSLGAEVAGNIKFDNSAAGKAFRYMWATFASGRRSVMGADQFSKVLARRVNEKMGAYIMALEDADGLKLKAAEKLVYAESQAEVIMNSNIPRISNALKAYANKGMFEDTFTDMGKTLQAFTQLIDKVPVLRVINPFLRVPANLIKQGVAMSPLAPLTSTFRDQVLRGSDVDRDMALIKWVIGSMYMSQLWKKAHMGELVGHLPGGVASDTYEHRNHESSIKIGDHWYNHTRMGPFSWYLNMAADSASMYGWTDDGAYKEQIHATVMQMAAKDMEDLPLFNSMANIVHATDSVYRGDDKAAQEFVSKLFSEAIPGVVRQYARSVDPVEGRPRSIWEGVEENIPYYSKNVFPKRDRWGYMKIPPVGSGPASSATKIQRLLNNLNPIPMSGDTDLDPVDKEEYKYGVDFKPMPDSITKGTGPKAVTAKLTEQQTDEWGKQAGHGLKLEGLNQHDYTLKKIQSPEYQNAPPYKQKEILINSQHKFMKAAQPKIDKQAVHTAVAQMKSMGGGEMGHPPVMRITKSMEEMKADGADTGALPPTEVTGAPSTGEVMPSGALPPTEVK